MKLKRLVIQGFKSFKDRTTVNFDRSITGIVGPNGCGKSNIVDALFWVMGEQSAKHLRGSSMKDIIFAGSSKYPPASFAEVTLVLENTRSKHIHIGQKVVAPSELALTRKLYRNGETEYRINGEHCRMRDIHEIFMDTGAGPKAYSIIAQGEIDRLVQVRPEERKTIIEEVAGVTKFKLRRKESLKKIEQTRSNLERIEDLRLEIEKNLKSLKKQSERAARAKDLKDKIEKSELLVSSHSVYSILKNYREGARTIQEKRMDMESWKLRKNSLEVGLEGERHQRDEKRSRLEIRMNRCNEISQNLAAGKERFLGLEKSLSEKEEQIQTRLEEADEFQKELEERRVRLAHLEKEKTHLKREGGNEEDFLNLEKKVREMKQRLEQDESQAERFGKSLDSLKRKKDELEQNIFKNQSRLEEVEKNLINNRQEMTFLKENHDRQAQGLSLLKQDVESAHQKENAFSLKEDEVKKLLQELEQKLEQKRDEQRDVLKKLAMAEASLAPSQKSGHREFLAKKSSKEFQSLQNLIQAQEHWKPAIQILLGELAQAIVHKQGDLDSLKDWFNSHSEQNVTFLKTDALQASEWEWLSEEMGEVHPLKNLMSFPESWQTSLTPLLEGFFVAEHLDIDQINTLPSPLPFKALVSRDGSIVIKNIHGSTFISINEENANVDILQSREESAQTEESIAHLKTQIIETKERYEKIRIELESIRTLRNTKSSLLETKHDNLNDIANQLNTITEKSEHLSRLKIELNQTRELDEKSLIDVQRKTEQFRTDLTELENRQGTLKTDYEQEKEKFLTKQAEVKSLEERLKMMDSQIDDIGEQIKRQQIRLDNTRQLVAQRKQEVMQLQKNIEELTQTNKTIEKNPSTRRNRICNAQRRIGTTTAKNGRPGK